jgi:hypothetical protein
MEEFFGLDDAAEQLVCESYLTVADEIAHLEGGRLWNGFYKDLLSIPGGQPAAQPCQPFSRLLGE